MKRREKKIEKSNLTLIDGLNRMHLQRSSNAVGLRKRAISVGSDVVKGGCYARVENLVENELSILMYWQEDINEKK